MHYVYVLRSASDDGFYIGYSANPRKRFEQHVKGDAFATLYRGQKVSQSTACALSEKESD